MFRLVAGGRVHGAGVLRPAASALTYGLRPARAEGRAPGVAPPTGHRARSSDYVHRRRSGCCSCSSSPSSSSGGWARGGALKWINNYGIQILIYVMLGWGLNIVVGLAGLLDLGYVAFYAVGAYSYALLVDDLRPVVLDLPAARRHARGAVGHDARLPGAAAARRLSRHRHARVRRDHPHHPDQLDRRSPTATPASRRSREITFFGLAVRRRATTASTPLRHGVLADPRHALPLST